MLKERERQDTLSVQQKAETAFPCLLSLNFLVGHMKRSISLSFRFTPAEKDALFKLAEQRGVSASELLRRIVRETVFHGPTFFDDQISDAFRLRHEVLKIGTNLNQVAKRIHSGQCETDPIKYEMIKSLLVNYSAVSELMRNVLQASRRRRAVLRMASLTKPR